VSQPFTVDDVLQSAVRDPVSYYHGEACRRLLTAWNGNQMDLEKIQLAHAYLGKLIEILNPKEGDTDAIA